jgi:hypothetical protein
MAWSYSGNPADSDKDAVRFLSGDTDISNQLISDEEITYCVARQSTVELAAAMALRAVAAGSTSSEESFKIGDVSATSKDLINKYLKMADNLDPMGITMGSFIELLPSIGGRSIAEKETLREDTDAVQPSFFRGMNDIPGGPGDSNYLDDEDWIS